MINLINPSMHGAAFDCESIIRPPTLDMHEMKQPRAIGVFIEHADGKKPPHVESGVG